MMNKQHNLLSAVLTLGLLLGLIGSILSAAGAQEKHPHYQVAIADLKYSRAWLLASGAQSAIPAERDAVKHIEVAINHLIKASIDDGKDLNDHPPVDANLQHRDRLEKALVLLLSAQKDLFGLEKDRKALAQRAMAVQHIADSIKATRQAINASRGIK